MSASVPRRNTALAHTAKKSCRPPTTAAVAASPLVSFGNVRPRPCFSVPFLPRLLRFLSLILIIMSRDHQSSNHRLSPLVAEAANNGCYNYKCPPCNWCDNPPSYSCCDNCFHFDNTFSGGSDTYDNCNLPGSIIYGSGGGGADVQRSTFSQVIQPGASSTWFRSN